MSNCIQNIENLKNTFTSLMNDHFKVEHMWSFSGLDVKEGQLFIIINVMYMDWEMWQVAFPAPVEFLLLSHSVEEMEEVLTADEGFTREIRHMRYEASQRRNDRRVDEDMESLMDEIELQLKDSNEYIAKYHVTLGVPVNLL